MKSFCSRVNAVHFWCLQRFWYMRAFLKIPFSETDIRKPSDICGVNVRKLRDVKCWSLTVNQNIKFINCLIIFLFWILEVFRFFTSIAINLSCIKCQSSGLEPFKDGFQRTLARGSGIDVGLQYGCGILHRTWNEGHWCLNYNRRVRLIRIVYLVSDLDV